MRLHHALTWGLTRNSCIIHGTGKATWGDSRVPVGGNDRNLSDQNVCFHTSCKVQNDIKLSASFPWSKGSEILSVFVCHQICRVVVWGLGSSKGLGAKAQNRMCLQPTPLCPGAGNGGRPPLLALNLSFLMDKAETSFKNNTCDNAL